MLIIGLTGGIGSGKSAVCALFSELDVPVIDADVIARLVVEPGQPALEQIRATFGDEILTPDGLLDRARLRALIFANPAKRKQLEAILHPAIRREMLIQAAQVQAPYCVFAIPLLIEVGQTDMVDRVLVVDAPDALRRQRLKQRDGLDDAQIDAIFAAQLERIARLAQADDIIHNAADLAHLRAQVLDLHDCYLKLAQLEKFQGK
ncbi:dephospho-CoA kinase [Candidatus Tenderia electrophaga]|jgi:dephospho-CoA kinase|uniref:Dephospho-CoA kinase n=1 Tax=Candidatus Tenderia electrophaga TaxID=1748243 RepID=A0A0S2T9H1_9GAMM|nr:dephospho-CoA kinase [Candidatus Tenderia electrophaga]